MDASRLVGRWGRFLREYVGNLDTWEGEPPAERRSNRSAREQVEWLEGEIRERGFSPAQEQDLLDGVRQALRRDAASDLPPPTR